MMNNLENVVKTDIGRCLAVPLFEDAWQLEKELATKYPSIIENFAAGLPVTDEVTTSPKQLITNINIERKQLELFLEMGCPMKKEESGVSVNISNTNRVDITMSFEDARSKVENMTSLSQPEIEDILSKISNLESIMKSVDGKSKKWDRSKDIIKWVADKGVDVGITVLPLIFQMLSQM